MRIFNRIKSIINLLLFRMYSVFIYIFGKRNKLSAKKEITFLSQEFYHEDFGGFGGFGKTLTNILPFLQEKGGFHSSVILTVKNPRAKVPAMEYCHGIPVFLRPHKNQGDIGTNLQYYRLTLNGAYRIFMSIDYYPSYEYPLMNHPRVPYVVWIRDPRDDEEWKKILTLDLVHKEYEGQNPERMGSEKAYSIKQVLNFSRYFNRKVVFASNGDFLTERARTTYGIPDLQARPLYNPIHIPELKEITFSSRPSLVFLGRMDPVKRPWIVFELARRMPDIDFFIAGKAHFEDVMKKMIDRYKSCSNLKFLGHTEGEKKDCLLRSCWGIINTSIHEGYPVSFQEAFSYGKGVVSCQNPDGLTEKFGNYTGEILSDGIRPEDLDCFEDHVRQFINSKDRLLEIGNRARLFVEERHSFDAFGRDFNRILNEEGII